MRFLVPWSPGVHEVFGLVRGPEGSRRAVFGRIFGLPQSHRGPKDTRVQDCWPSGAAWGPWVREFWSGGAPGGPGVRDFWSRGAVFGSRVRDFCVVEPLGALGYETFGPPEPLSALGYGTFGPPHRAAAGPRVRLLTGSPRGSWSTRLLADLVHAKYMNQIGYETSAPLAGRARV